jgi:DNA-binding CsgD family transcriptional regulator
MEKPRTFRLALSTVWPGLRYMGLGVWVAWLFLISSGSIWLSDVEVDGFYLANLMLVMTISSAVVCLIAPFAQRFYGILLTRRRLLMGVALLAALGSLGVIAAGPYYLGTPILFWPGIILIGVFSGVFSLKCGQVFGELDSRRIMFYSLLSELMMVAISYFVLGNDIYSPVPGGPPLSGIAAFTLLPLIATYLIGLPAVHEADTPGQHQNGDSAIKNAEETLGDAGFGDAPSAATSKSRFDLHTLPSAFWRFLAVIFVFTVVSELVRCYFVFIHVPHVTYIDSVVVLLLRTSFAVLMLAFALRSRKHLRFSRMYLFSLVAIAAATALIPLLQIHNAIFSSLIGFASNVMVFLIWCVLASVTSEKQFSPIVIFGFGRSALLVGQTCGWILGMWVLPKLAGANWEPLFYVVLAILVLVMVTLFFSEQQFDRLFGEIASVRISLDFSILNRDERKKYRPWHEACRQAGEQAMLSSREQEIFELLVIGRSPNNIATHLVLSLNTVRTHIRNIYAKFNVHNKTELVSHVEAILKENDNPPLP